MAIIMITYPLEGLFFRYVVLRSKYCFKSNISQVYPLSKMRPENKLSYFFPSTTILHRTQICIFPHYFPFEEELITTQRRDFCIVKSLNPKTLLVCIFLFCIFSTTENFHLPFFSGEKL